MRILYPFASRSRPKKFIDCIENIYINSRTEDYVILASLDTDDTTMNNETMIEKMKCYDKLYPIWGTSISKVNAINRAMIAAPEFDILINMSDDMMFVKEGFDTDIIDAMTEHFQDTDGVLHFNDGNQRDNVMTMTIYGRKFYERFNYIYHPSYESLFCDNEQTKVAKMLKKYKYMGDNNIIFKHFHPAWGLASMDAQYEKTESKTMWNKDELNFMSRQRNNFDLPYQP